MVGPECGGTWRRKAMSPHHISKFFWTAAPKVKSPTYDLLTVLTNLQRETCNLYFVTDRTLLLDFKSTLQ